MKEIILVIVLVVVLITVAIGIYLYISQPIQPTIEQPTQQPSKKVSEQPSGFKVSPSTIINNPIDCELSEWSKWSDCDSSGVQRKQRTVIVEPKNGGNPCGVLTEEMLCKVDCKLSEWTDWGKCDSSNIQERKRTVLIEPKNGGNPCGNLVEKKTCPITTTTPSTTVVNCQVSDWKEEGDSSCKIPSSDDLKINASLKQLTQYRKRTRQIIQSSLNGGTACPTNLVEFIECKQDCKLSDFVLPPDTACTKDADGMFYKRPVRTVLSAEQAGGKSCPQPGSPDFLGPKVLCPDIDCVVSDFDSPADSSCTKKADGKWYKTATRKIIKDKVNNGKACPPLTQDIPCPSQECITTPPTYGNCFTETDGKDYRYLSRNVLVSPLNTNTPCPPLSVKELCPDANCQVGPWYDIQGTTCTLKSDGKYYKQQKRDITSPKRNNGQVCPPLTQDVLCNMDCKVGDWYDKPNTPCFNKADGKAYKIQIRNVTINQQGSGLACPTLTQDVLCNAVDCKVSNWTTPADTSCSKKADGKWYKTKTRTITQQPNANGTQCPPLTEDVLCPAKDCQYVLSGVEASATCDLDGQINNIYKITQFPQFGGKECPTYNTTTNTFTMKDASNYCRCTQDANYALNNLESCKANPNFNIQSLCQSSSMYDKASNTYFPIELESGIKCRSVGYEPCKFNPYLKSQVADCRKAGYEICKLDVNYLRANPSECRANGIDPCTDQMYLANNAADCKARGFNPCTTSIYALRNTVECESTIGIDWLCSNSDAYLVTNRDTKCKTQFKEKCIFDKVFYQGNINTCNSTLGTTSDTISKSLSKEYIRRNNKLSFQDMFIRDNRGNYKNLY